jgi:hypothetical protein
MASTAAALTRQKAAKARRAAVVMDFILPLRVSDHENVAPERSRLHPGFSLALHSE